MDQVNDARKKHRVRQTPATRLGALALALLILAAALAYTFMETGNPFSKWYTQKKLEAHARAYHPDEAWQVGPAEYQLTGPGKARYICQVRRQGSDDDVFEAYFQDGAAFTTRRSLVESGYNTYRRALQYEEDLLNAAGVAQALEGTAALTEGTAALTVDFAVEGRTDVFNPDSPVFATDSACGRDARPLPTVLWLEDYAQQEELVTDEAAAQNLRALKRAAARGGLSYDYYGVRISFYNSAGQYIAWVPAGDIGPWDGAGADPLARALAAAEPRVEGLGGANEKLRAFAGTQAAWISTMRTFVPCGH